MDMLWRLISCRIIIIKYKYEYLKSVISTTQVQAHVLSTSMLIYVVYIKLCRNQNA